MSTAQDKGKNSPSDFQGPTAAHQTPQEPRGSSVSTSISPGKLFSWSRPLIEKRQLFLGLPPTSPSLTALPHSRPKTHPLCLSSGILTRCPFGKSSTESSYNELQLIIVAVVTVFTAPLGPTDPCSTAVHMEPFSTLVLKILT